MRLGGWLVFLGIFAAAVYYIFFAAPELVIIPPPASYGTIAPLANISLEPQSVLNSPQYLALKPPPFAMPTATGPASVGRANPFVSP